jgi:hypothetical protein
VTRAPSTETPSPPLTALVVGRPHTGYPPATGRRWSTRRAAAGTRQPRGWSIASRRRSGLALPRRCGLAHHRPAPHPPHHHHRAPCPRNGPHASRPRRRHGPGAFDFGGRERESCRQRVRERERESARQRVREKERLSRGRFATPADSPRHDCASYRELRVRRWGLGFVHHYRTLFCRAVPNLNDSQLLHRCLGAGRATPPAAAHAASAHDVVSRTRARCSGDAKRARRRPGETL